MNRKKYRYEFRFVNLILGKISKVIQKLSKKQKGIIVSLSFFAISLIYVINGADFFYVPLSIRSILGYCMLGVIMTVIYKPIASGNVTKISYIYILFSFFILLTSAINSINYLPTAVFLSIILPFFSVVMKGFGDYNWLFDKLANGFLAGFMVITFFNIFSIPFNLLQYSGLMENANTLGQICLAVFPLGVYKLENCKTNMRIVWGGGISFVVATMIYTESRTAIFGGLLQGLLWLIYIFKKNEKHVLKSILCIGKGVIIGLVFIFILTTMINNWSGILKINEKRKYSYYPPYYQEMYDTVVKKSTPDVFESAYIRLVVGNLSKNNKKEISQIQQTMDINSYSTGRIDYWEKFIRETNLIGHDGETTIYIEKDKVGTRNAHNTFLQINFENGIITMILFILLCIQIGYVCIIMFFKRENTKMQLLVLMTCAGYFFASLVSSQLVVFAYELTFVFWIVYLPIMNKEMFKE